MGNPSTPASVQNASGSNIAQASGNSSASVTQHVYNITINSVEQLNVLGQLLSQDYSGPASAFAPPSQSHRSQATTSLPATILWERGRLLYELNLNGSNREIEAALEKWRVASNSRRQPHAAIADGVIGIGHDDGVTFNLIPVDPIDNCSVECDLRIINFGDSQSNWGGIRVRGFDFCPDFRLGYLVYLRQSKTIDLYGPNGVIEGEKEVPSDAADSWTNLRVDVFDSQIQVNINGDRRISVEDKNFGGKGLIYLHTFRTHTQFRNFRVYELIRK